MRYLGGKSRLARHVGPIIESFRQPGQLYLEPFVGGGSILCAIENPRYACDLSQALITMWIALRDGWEPPQSVTRDEWEWARAVQDPTDPRTAMIGFGCSYGASWFGAWAQDSEGRGQSESVYRGLKKQQPQIQGVHFENCDYRTLDPDGLVVYCDPPYKGTAGYKAVGKFDSEEFWDTVFRWAKRNVVLVSEFSAPDDPGIQEIWSIRRKVTMARTNYTEKVDRLYRIWP